MRPPQVAKGKPDDAARELQRNLGMALEMIEQQYNLWQAWRRERTARRRWRAG